MIRRLFVIAAAFSLMGCAVFTKVFAPTSTPIPTSTPTLSPEAVEKEEYAVYSALIGINYPAELIVIRDHTSPGLESGGLDETMEYIQEEMSIEQELVDSFKARNDQSYPLDDAFTLKAKVILVSDADLHDIFNAQSGWDEFYKQYPDSQGEMTLSRVGFNHDMTEALVYVGNQSYYLAGAGWYVWLVKVNGAWEIKQQVMSWIS